MRSIASWHLLECLSSSFCRTCPLNCSCVKVLKFQIICDIQRSLLLSKNGGESCAGSRFLAGNIALGWHRAPSMTRDSICFGVYVDGVCAVGCDRPKVLSAVLAVKATLDAAGLQCLEVEADTSKQVFTGLQLDHKTGLLSLEASRIWRLRRGLEYAARQRHLTGEQVAKLIRHITWSCLLRRPALSLNNAGYCFARTFGPRSGPATACRRASTPMDRVIAATSHLQPCQPLVAVGPATDASGGTHGSYGVTHAPLV